MHALQVENNDAQDQFKYCDSATDVRHLPSPVGTCIIMYDNKPVHGHACHKLPPKAQN